MKRIILIIILSSLQIFLWGQSDTVAYQQLDETVVSSYRNTNLIKGDFAKGIQTTAVQLNKFPKLFGQVDPLVFAQSLPGIQTNAILSYGMNIQGCNDSHNHYTIADLPFMMPPRLLGLFPVINTDHFTEIDLSKISKNNYLGGALAFDIADTIPNKISFNGSIGLISAQASLKIPFNDKLSLITSARSSFINALYHNVISIDEGSLTTDFRDYNVTLLWKPDKKNTIDANLLYSNDFYVIDYGSNGYYFDIKSPQTIAGIRWKHDGDVLFNNRFYYLNKLSDIKLLNEIISAGLISSINEIGWSGDFKFPYGINWYNHINYYDILPQNPSISYVNDIGLTPQSYQTAIEISTKLNKEITISDITISPSLTFNYYKEFEYEDRYINLDPELSVKWNLYHIGNINFNVGSKHQYIAQSSMTPGGIPTQFSYAMGHIIPPQQSIYADLSYNKDFDHNKWSVSSQIYFKQLTNQAEYYGFLFNLMTSDYHIEDNLINTSGYNYGANIMLSKNAGDITGWIAYSYGRAIRSTNDKRFPDYFSASHERPHEFNMVMTYHLNQFEFAANYVLASGTPFTEIKSLYIIQDAILADFGDFNGRRLSPYMKLDLTATYHFKTKGNIEHGINLSLYNATCQKNQIGYRMKVLEGNTFIYGPAKLFFSTIPSINYFIKL